MKDHFHIEGMKRTPQREAIFRFLEGNTGHPSAEDIYERVKEEFPYISLATVYNTLDLLIEHKRAQEIFIDPHRRRFDPNPRPHNHLICVRCSRVADIEADLPEDFFPEVTEGYKILGHHLEVYGICPDCQAEGKE